MSLKRRIAKTKFGVYMWCENGIFGHTYSGASFLDRLAVYYWRIRNCNHDTPMCLDIGDEEHIVMYCFSCGRRLGFKKYEFNPYN